MAQVLSAEMAIPSIGFGIPIIYFLNPIHDGGMTILHICNMYHVLTMAYMEVWIL